MSWGTALALAQMMDGWRRRCGANQHFQGCLEREFLGPEAKTNSTALTSNKQAPPSVLAPPLFSQAAEPERVVN